MCVEVLCLFLAFATRVVLSVLSSLAIIYSLHRRSWLLYFNGISVFHCCCLLLIFAVVALFCFVLAHLIRRLMGELIVYQSLRRPSVRRPSVNI